MMISVRYCKKCKFKMDVLKDKFKTDNLKIYCENCYRDLQIKKITRRSIKNIFRWFLKK